MTCDVCGWSRPSHTLWCPRRPAGTLPGPAPAREAAPLPERPGDAPGGARRYARELGYWALMAGGGLALMAMVFALALLGPARG